jgi:hypothetical protein
MKSFLLRPALMLALLAGLSACGGKASFEVGGTITGLKYPGLELSDGKTSVFPTADGHFGFPTRIDYADSYKITMKKQPAHQTCMFLNNTDGNDPLRLTSFDTAGRLATINAIVDCTTHTHSVGGKVTGLTSGSVEIINGSLYGTFTVLSTDTDPKYVFAGVPYDQVYGISVLKQPDGLNCTFSASPTGKMGDSDIGDLNLVCKPK